MAKNPNNVTIYIRDENLEAWKKVGSGFQSDFVNWCLKNKYKDYKEYLTKIMDNNRLM